MDLKKYYFQNVKKTDYHYRFFGAIKEAKNLILLKEKTGQGHVTLRFMMRKKR